jgi:hypothetical protein
MRIRTVKALLASAVLGSLMTATGPAQADEPGVVKISDRVQQVLGQEILPAPAPASDVTLEPLPEGAIVEGNITEGEVIYLDEHGRRIRGPWGLRGLRGSNRPEYMHQTYGPNGEVVQTWEPRTYRTRIGLAFSGDPYAGKLPPDYGFVPPTAWPYVQRESVEYQRYHADPLYGTPGMQYSNVQLPMVYMPTDTTQLGFNYMHVPQWRPDLCMYPPAPNPIKWERRVDRKDPTKVEQWNGVIRDKNLPKKKKIDDGAIDEAPGADGAPAPPDDGATAPAPLDDEVPAPPQA